MTQPAENNPDISKPENSFLHTSEDPFSKRTLYEVFLLSAFSFIVTALFLQFLMTLLTAVLLKHYSISFTYSLFCIQFSSYSYTVWTPGMVYLVYGVAQTVFFAAGFLLLRVRVKTWKIQLAITWKMKQTGAYTSGIPSFFPGWQVQ